MIGSLVHALALVAQTQGGAAPLDLAAVTRAALANSTQVRIAQNEVKAARARAGQESSRLRPQLVFNGTATRYADEQTLNFGGQNVTAVPDHLETLSLQLTQILDFTNQIAATVSQARLNALSYEYALQSTREDVALEATTEYYELLRTGQNVNVAEAALAAYRQQLQTTTRLYEGGVGQRIDVYRATSQVADAERELVRRQNELNSARSRLNDTIGRPLDTDTRVVATAPVPAGLAPAGGEATETTPGTPPPVTPPVGGGTTTPPPVQTPPITPPAPATPQQLTPPGTPTQDRPALIQQALGRRPELLAGQVELQAAQRGIQIVRAANQPTFSLNLTGNYFPTPALAYPSRSVTALTFQVSIPILDGGLAKERSREARANSDTAKARLERTQRDVSLQVQNAAFEVETAQRRLQAARVAVDAAVAARRLAQQRYEAQVGLYIEVTDAQAALTQAQAGQVDATYDLLSAQARLARATGQPLTR